MLSYFSRDPYIEIGRLICEFARIILRASVDASSAGGRLWHQVVELAHSRNQIVKLVHSRM